MENLVGLSSSICLSFSLGGTMKFIIFSSMQKSMNLILNSSYIFYSSSIALFITTHISSIASFSLFLDTIIQSSSFQYTSILLPLISFSYFKHQFLNKTNLNRNIYFSTFIAYFNSFYNSVSSTFSSSTTAPFFQFLPF